MKKTILFSVFAGLLLMAISCQSNKYGDAGNPFFTEYDTPFKVPPFNKIDEEHYMPAFRAGMAEETEEVAAIVSSTEAPTFENTIEALEFTGSLLTKVSYVFGNLFGSMNNEEMQKIAAEIAPLRSKHGDDIRLNPDLFARVKAVWDGREGLNLTQEQGMLLEEAYKGFVRGGANLTGADKERFREINTELSLLTLKFGNNLLAENKAYAIVIENESDLAGLSESQIAGAAEAAASRGEEGKWVFTMDKPSWIPFLTYSENRELRETIYKMWFNRGDNDNEYDNKEVLTKIAALRLERANLLGYETHAHFVLEENMAKVPERVYDLLGQLWKPALAMAKRDAYDLQALARKEGDNITLESWDWWYYAEKLRKEKFDLDEEALRPYFKLENVREGAFYVANKLFGITFEERFDIPKYHEDVKTFEVKDADGSHLGIYLVDYFPRGSKRGGAWMNSFRKQSRQGGVEKTPIIVNVCNFTKPTGGNPALLSFEEVNTLFHEFGHALHGLLSNSTYNSLTGTSVPRDFVELPSQIMESWTSEPEVLNVYAKHYETGEVIPMELVNKIIESGTFNQGFATVEAIAACYLDMDWHTIKDSKTRDTDTFEKASMKKIGIIPEIIPRYRSVYFQHIFAGGYSSGYYSYTWADVLVADAYQAFKETNIFDKATADAYRKNILEPGGTEDPMTLYVRFRGAEPKIDALMKKRGLK